MDPVAWKLRDDLISKQLRQITATATVVRGDYYCDVGSPPLEGLIYPWLAPPLKALTQLLSGPTLLPFSYH
jgi:hypothetical protein